MRDIFTVDSDINILLNIDVIANICRPSISLTTDFKLIIKLGYLFYHSPDEVAEWLRRWTANPLGSPRVSSNLILVDSFFTRLLYDSLLKEEIS